MTLRQNLAVRSSGPDSAIKKKINVQAVRTSLAVFQPVTAIRF